MITETTRILLTKLHNDVKSHALALQKSQLESEDQLKAITTSISQMETQIAEIEKDLQTGELPEYCVKHLEREKRNLGSSLELKRQHFRIVSESIRDTAEEVEAIKQQQAELFNNYVKGDVENVDD